MLRMPYYAWHQIFCISGSVMNGLARSHSAPPMAISYIALCAYHLITLFIAHTQKNRQAPTTRAQFTKMINKHK